MIKKRSAILIKKADWNRALLSETTPAEVPVLVSNDGFYLNISSGNFPQALQPFIDNFILPAKEKRFSIPFSYKITKDPLSLRRLGLPHPRAQLDVVDFYRRYQALIPHYCGRGSFSIRRPKKLASHYYAEGKNQEAFAYKSQIVSTQETDTTTKHAASIFTYYKFQRLHKFFTSPMFSNLERKYMHMASLDVSKCFDSIYTHSVAWAAKSKVEAKRSTKAESFGGAFDRLMQLMNYNETNGIIIGPEVSRIFAEVIFDRIDLNVENQLRQKGHILGKDYSVYRYVDNIYVFYNDERVYRDVHMEVAAALDFYKLGLNTSKTEYKKRPFFTSKSMAISEATSIRSEYFDRAIGSLYTGKLQTYYVNVSQSSSLNLKDYSNALRRACHLAQSDYESLASFLISGLRVRVQRVLSSRLRFEAYLNTDPNFFPGVDAESYQAFVARYLCDTIDLCMHTYTLSPSVSSSLDVATILIMAADTLKQFDSDHFLHVQERLQMWMSRLMVSSAIRTLIDNEHAVPIEVLNILCALKSFDYDAQNFKDIIENTIGVRKGASYFEIISILFVLKDLPKNSKDVKAIFLSAQAKILDDVDLSLSSESIHLFLDILACPYIDRKDRRNLYRKVISEFNISRSGPEASGSSLPAKATNDEIELMFEFMERNPWFVNWSEIDLLRLIEKKRLRIGYV